MYQWEHTQGQWVVDIVPALFLSSDLKIKPNEFLMYVSVFLCMRAYIHARGVPSSTVASSPGAGVTGP